MAKIKSFEEVDCWNSAKKLTVKKLTVLLYTISKLKMEVTTKAQWKHVVRTPVHNMAERFVQCATKKCIQWLNISMAATNEIHHMILLYAKIGFTKYDKKEKAIEVLRAGKMSRFSLHQLSEPKAPTSSKLWHISLSQ